MPATGARAGPERLDARREAAGRADRRVLGRALRSAPEEPCRAAGLEDHAVAQALVLHLPAVDPRAVAAAQVLDQVLAGAHGDDARVLARHERVDDVELHRRRVLVQRLRLATAQGQRRCSELDGRSAPRFEALVVHDPHETRSKDGAPAARLLTLAERLLDRHGLTSRCAPARSSPLPWTRRPPSAPGSSGR